MRRVRRRVERRLGGRVVQRGIAEAADDDRVVGPGALDAELARPVDRDRHPHRARQVRGDRRGLRDHGQLVVAEHLVAAAGDRLVDRGGHALHHVGDAVPAGLARAGEIERAGAVVQKRRIGGSQRKGDRRVALVPGRSDRVEGALLLLQPARRVIAVPALDLRAPERLGLAGRQATETPSGGSSVSKAARRCCSSGSRSSGIMVSAAEASAEEHERANDLRVERLFPHDRPARLDLAVRGGQRGRRRPRGIPCR